MNKTKIEWCDSTWNPVTGCLHACEYCYAKRIARRFCHEPWNTVEDGINHFVGSPIQDEFCNTVTASVGRIDPYPYGFDPTFHRYRLVEPMQKKRSRNIFVCSMADLFGDWVPNKWIQEVFAACEAAPQHRYLFLTKNPYRYGELKSKAIPYNGIPSGDGFWYGTTLTCNSDFDDRGSDLCSALYFSKHNIFLSIEPILERIDEKRISNVKYVKWVIIGAETGKRKGKVTPERSWIDDILQECDRNKVPVFMKNSLVPIMGEASMRREFPNELKEVINNA